MKLQQMWTSAGHGNKMKMRLPRSREAHDLAMTERWRIVEQE